MSLSVNVTWACWTQSDSGTEREVTHRSGRCPGLFWIRNSRSVYKHEGSLLLSQVSTNHLFWRRVGLLIFPMMPSAWFSLLIAVFHLGYLQTASEPFDEIVYCCSINMSDRPFPAVCMLMTERERGEDPETLLCSSFRVVAKQD